MLFQIEFNDHGRDAGASGHYTLRNLPSAAEKDKEYIQEKVCEAVV